MSLLQTLAYVNEAGNLLAKTKITDYMLIPGVVLQQGVPTMVLGTSANQEVISTGLVAILLSDGEPLVIVDASTAVLTHRGFVRADQLLGTDQIKVRLKPVDVVLDVNLATYGSVSSSEISVVDATAYYQFRGTVPADTVDLDVVKINPSFLATCSCCFGEGLTTEVPVLI